MLARLESIMKLHHIGIVVKSINQSLGELGKYLNFETKTMILPVASQKVNICLLKVGEPFIELIEPASPDSAISEFAKSGGGIHHLCFEVKNIQSELDRLEEKGATVLVKPVEGFDNRRIAFVDLNAPNTKCGLVELLEIPQ
jgi:methylmalonyl-CoA/ethylmalonyl-CoA epimerase